MENYFILTESDSSQGFTDSFNNFNFYVQFYSICPKVFSSGEPIEKSVPLSEGLTEASLKKHETKNGDPRKSESIKKFQFAGNDTVDSGFDEKLAVNIGIMATKLTTG